MEFEDNELPFIRDALEVDNHGKRCVMEVAQHIGNHVVRCILLASGEGLQKDMEVIGASGDTELFEKASNINGFQGGRVANNLYISPFRATVFKTAALFLHLNSSVVIRVRKPLFFPL